MTIFQVLPLISVSPMSIVLPAKLLLFIKITRVLLRFEIPTVIQTDLLNFVLWPPLISKKNLKC